MCVQTSRKGHKVYLLKFLSLLKYFFSLFLYPFKSKTLQAVIVFPLRKHILEFISQISQTTYTFSFTCVWGGHKFFAHFS